ncbi:MAG: hypothetical protein HQK49_09285 [Oligoflexia bacterium]|nr:hypothetical protein [Oligoflexia bacterium]
MSSNPTKDITEQNVQDKTIIIKNDIKKIEEIDEITEIKEIDLQEIDVDGICGVY